MQLAPSILASDTQSLKELLIQIGPDGARTLFCTSKLIRDAVLRGSSRVQLRLAVPDNIDQGALAAVWRQGAERTLGRTAAACKALAVQLAGLDRLAAAFAPAAPNQPPPAAAADFSTSPAAAASNQNTLAASTAKDKPTIIPSRDATTACKKLLSGATYFVNTQLTSLVSLSLEGLVLDNWIPEFLCISCPNLASLQLACCAFNNSKRPHDPLSQFRPKSDKLACLTIHNPSFFVPVEAAPPAPPSSSPFPTQNAHLNLSPLFNTIRGPGTPVTAKTTIRPVASTPSAPVKMEAYKLEDVPSLTSVDLRMDNQHTHQLSSSLRYMPADITHLLAFGSLLQRLTFGTTCRNQRVPWPCLPALLTLAEHLTALTHIDLGTTGWVIDNKAAIILARSFPSLTHLTVMGFGLVTSVKADWNHVTIMCREREVHMPSLGCLDLPHLQEPVTITQPLSSGKQQPLRLSFSNLKPGAVGDYEDTAIMKTISVVKKAGCSFRPEAGQAGLFVAIESTSINIWRSMLDLLGPRVTALQIDRGMTLDKQLLKRLEQHVGTSLRHLVLVSMDDMGDDVWAVLLSSLPQLSKLTVMEPMAGRPFLYVSDLLAGLSRPLTLVVSESSQKWVQSGLRLMPHKQVHTLLTVQYTTE